ncbi:META domain-containing protein [Helicobacter sp.]|uniref:META domain-containing protein n=1 Tax=Helicobacter sp. TaxID=218 RepID=UPI0025C6F662|nr:META domain-containing protein [Helicobacter sp.]MCI5968877.1 META domain-containing protein [Helicobacter sp.]MDY2584987.1 META domain-containing protein [Helicobacter sp.]
MTKLAKVGIFLAGIVPLVMVGCGKSQEKYNIVPNNPQSVKCYHAGTNTARNCDDTDYNKVLESKKDWRIAAYSYKHAVTPLKSDAQSNYSVRFEKGMVNGSFGCNSFFGAYSLKDGILKVENAGMTRKMCDEKAMKDEAMLTERFLNAQTKILLVKEGDTMGKIFFLGKDFYLVLD